MIAFVAALAMSLQTPAIHPFFDTSIEGLEQAYDAGIAACKRKVKPADLIGPWRKDIGRARSPGSTTWTTSFVVIDCPMLQAYLDGFFDEKEYNDHAKGRENLRSLVDCFTKLPKEQTSMFMAVQLFAWPRVGGLLSNQITGQANEEDVRSVKFVLFVDDGPPIHPIVDPELVASGGGTGFNDISETRAANVVTYGRTNSYSTVYYTTDRVEA